MKAFHQNLLSTILFVVALCVAPFSAVKADDNADLKRQADGLVSSLKEKYESLPPTGKFATGAVFGFTGSRVVTRSAMTVVKGK